MQEPVSVLQQIKLEKLPDKDVKDDYVSKLIIRFDELDEVCGRKKEMKIYGSHLRKEQQRSLLKCVTIKMEGVFWQLVQG